VAAPRGAARGPRAIRRRVLRAPDRPNTQEDLRRLSNERSAENGRPSLGRPSDPQPGLGERHYLGLCGACGSRKADATYTAKYGAPEWLIGSRHSACPGGAECLRLLAEQAGTTPVRFKADPRPYLAAFGPSGRSTVATGEQAELPPRAAFAGWHSALLAEGDPLTYLMEKRGVSLEIIKRHEVGWDGTRLVFPVRRDGELVAFKTREPRPAAQMKCCPGSGRTWPLYPEPEPDWSWALLVAGDLDALRGQSAELPACSVTLGAGAWRDDWTEPLRGLCVAVCFDNNEQAQARTTVRRLREGGVSARYLDLRSLGLRAPKGDLSDHLNGGGSPDVIERAARSRVVRVRRTR
jgi:hypothetical protein